MRRKSTILLVGLAIGLALVVVSCVGAWELARPPLDLSLSPVPLIFRSDHRASGSS